MPQIKQILNIKILVFFFLNKRTGQKFLKNKRNSEKNICRLKPHFFLSLETVFHRVGPEVLTQFKTPTPLV